MFKYKKGDEVFIPRLGITTWCGKEPTLHCSVIRGYVISGMKRPIDKVPYYQIKIDIPPNVNEVVKAYYENELFDDPIALGAYIFNELRSLDASYNNQGNI